MTAVFLREHNGNFMEPDEKFMLYDWNIMEHEDFLEHVWNFMEQDWKLMDHDMNFTEILQNFWENIFKWKSLQIPRFYS